MAEQEVGVYNRAIPPEWAELHRLAWELAPEGMRHEDLTIDRLGSMYDAAYDLGLRTSERCAYFSYGLTAGVATPEMAKPEVQQRLIEGSAEELVAVHKSKAALNQPRMFRRKPKNGLAQGLHCDNISFENIKTPFEHFFVRLEEPKPAATRLLQDSIAVACNNRRYEALKGKPVTSTRIDILKWIKNGRSTATDVAKGAVAGLTHTISTGLDKLAQAHGSQYLKDIITDDELRSFVPEGTARRIATAISLGQLFSLKDLIVVENAQVRLLDDQANAGKSVSNLSVEKPKFLTRDESEICPAANVTGLIAIISKVVPVIFITAQHKLLAEEQRS